MAVLKNWRAKRAGGKITVYGESIETRKEMKITQVDEIVPGTNCCIARGADGSKHSLLVG